MEHQINETPFKMNEISGKLFNLEFLSDITFLIESYPPIHAHSLELMKRSTVFQELLQQTYRETKLISITGYRYTTFYEFIRYIYTDDCDVDDDNCMELFKLAKTYNVIRLQNFITSKMNELELFECYGLSSSAINSVFIRDQIILNLSNHLPSLASSSEEVVEEILKFDHVTDVSEFTMFNALATWINKQCATNHIPLSDRRQRFDNLIRLIRFPVMTDDELRFIKIQYPDLLTRQDYAYITEQKVFGAECKGDIWNAISRKEYKWPYELKKISTKSYFETKFSVSTGMVLRGFVVPPMFTRNISIKITSHSSAIQKITLLNFTMPYTNFIDLGRTIRLLPNHTYSIEYNNERDIFHRIFQVPHRLSGHNLIVHDPTNSVKILQTHETMLEIFFEKTS